MLIKTTTKATGLRSMISISNRYEGHCERLDNMILYMKAALEYEEALDLLIKDGARTIYNALTDEVINSANNEMRKLVELYCELYLEIAESKTCSRGLTDYYIGDLIARYPGLIEIKPEYSCQYYAKYILKCSGLGIRYQ